MAELVRGPQPDASLSSHFFCSCCNQHGAFRVAQLTG
jgi:hypothetical protein